MTLGSHQRVVGKSQVHLTPRWILERLGPFDVDPAAADPRPWDCATINYSERDDGLSRPWRGRVWLNPPFDRFQVALWIGRLATHGNGTALLHARTETEWFEPVWEHASGILFLAERLKFCRVDGTAQPHNSGAPAILVSFGQKDLARLRASGIAGHLCTGWERVGLISRSSVLARKNGLMLPASILGSSGIGAVHAFIERAQAMPRQGAVNMRKRAMSRIRSISLIDATSNLASSSACGPKSERR